MDSRNPLNPYSESPSYSYLLHSQNFQYGSYPSTQYPSEIPPYSSQQPDGPPKREDPALASKERRQWTPADDEVVISAWLNTSKDAVVGNEQKSGTFWKRVAEYYESTPHAKESAERQITSGQSETDVLKMAYDIYYADHKRKFNLEYAWCVLRFEQKWLMTSSTTVGDEEVRPEGVKAAKARRKVGQGKSLADVTTVMEMKERLSKLAILDTLLAKTGPLSKAEEIVKNKLFAQYF
ncbi:glutathione S-transferase T2-like [Brassica napus]|uniref:glutathione S-transferase T2-like n=1 Tax=Brassica napus TaxID=3708 RepID=UPI0020793A5A|nr:glutathione S-transferase T2-like [Brassica napus]